MTDRKRPYFIFWKVRKKKGGDNNGSNHCWKKNSGKNEK